MVFWNRSKLFQKFLNDWSIGHSSTKNKNKSHLHRESQQAPYTAAPVVDHFNRTLPGCRHCGDKYNDCQNNTENKWIWQKTLYKAYTAICKFLNI